MTRDRDGSGEAGQTAQQAGPKATARAGGIAQAQSGMTDPTKTLPTVASVENQLRDLIAESERRSSSGMSLSDWIDKRLREARFASLHSALSSPEPSLSDKELWAREFEAVGQTELAAAVRAYREDGPRSATTHFATGLRAIARARATPAPDDMGAGEEIFALVRTEAKRLTGGNCAFVDDDLRAIVTLASPALVGADIDAAATQPSSPPEGELAIAVDAGSANSHIFEDRILVDDETIAFSSEPWTSRIREALATRTDPPREREAIVAYLKNRARNAAPEFVPVLDAVACEIQGGDHGDFGTAPSHPLPADKLAELLSELTRKRDRVHPTNRRADLPMGIKLRFGDLEALILFLAAEGNGS